MIKYLPVALFLMTVLPSTVWGQSSPAAPPDSSKKMSEAEQQELSSALAEAGNSPVEFIRVLERHLQKYPKSAQADEIERALVKAAMEAKDDPRILLYGERVLAKNPDNPQVLERVTRILLNSEDKESSERALKYGRKFEELLRALQKEGPSSSRDRGRMEQELHRALARALVFQARSSGNLGNVDQAVELASKSYATYPNAESAREAGKWLAKAGRNLDAVQKYAEAFTISDPNNTDAGRAKDRATMGELYRKEKGSEAGLGDVVLQAYDQTALLEAKRRAEQRERDPNADQTEAAEFTVTGLNRDKLKLKSLNGKVVVMDFWATWCGPCRVQHPLYEEVKKRFADRDDVVFLAINTDEDPALVEPFLNANKWNKSSVYFEDGLSNLLRVSSIPTTVILNKRGKLVSRMNGFLPERFVDQLTDRIKEALKESE